MSVHACENNFFSQEVALAVLRGYCTQAAADDARTRMSSYIISESLLALYTEEELLPNDLQPGNRLVQQWAIKVGHGMRKLVACMHIDLFFWLCWACG